MQIKTGAAESGSNNYGIEDGYFNSKNQRRKLKANVKGYLKKMMLMINRQNMKIYKLHLIY